MPGFQDGQWWVQNFSAYLPTLLFGDLTGRRVLDLCAAPGGKTASLIQQGAIVTALDVSETRMARLRESLDRLGFEAELIVADVLDYMPAAPFDAVLLDAPCSATGTVRRHPDVLYLKSGEQINQLAALQAKMLDRVVDFVAPGGTVIYCTCSLEPEEGEKQMNSFLARHDTLDRVPIKAEEVFQQEDWLTVDGDLRLLPFHSPVSSYEANPLLDELAGLDGFFISRFRIKAA